MKKIPAFTIVELLVAMLLLGITATIAMSTLNIVQYSFNSQELDNQTFVDFSVLHAVLKEDAAKASKMLIDENSCIFVYPNADIQYTIHPTKIKRTHSVHGGSSFFSQKVRLKKAQFRQEAVQAGLVDYIEWTIELAGKEIPIGIYKSYDATTLQQLNYGR